MSHHTRLTALKVASFVTAASGFLMIAALVTPAETLLIWFFDLAILPLDGAQGVTAETTRFLTGVCGGVVMSWGAMCWLVTTRVFADDPGLGRAILLPSVLVWFLADGLGSVLAGGWFNVVLNCGFLALFLVPLLKADAPRPRS